MRGEEVWKLIVYLIQSIFGFHFWSQGIPRMTWGRESHTIMNFTISEKVPEENEVVVVHWMVP